MAVVVGSAFCRLGPEPKETIRFRKNEKGPVYGPFTKERRKE
jgi:hypothetical protein